MDKPGIGAFVAEVINPARLQALRRLGLLDSPAEAAFDRLGRLASEVVNCPVALVTLVDEDRQFFKSCLGLKEPWATWRSTPLSHSFCQHVLVSSDPLVIPDARRDPRFRENLAIRDLDVVAYLGIPLKLSTGEILGSFCVIDNVPRQWTPREIRLVEDIAASVITEIELRSEILHKQEAFRQIQDLNHELKNRTGTLEATNKDLEAFNHAITHDLRAPLRSMTSFTTLLSEEWADRWEPEPREYLNLVMSSAERMNSILDGLAGLSRLSNEPIFCQPVDLSKLAESILNDLSRSEPNRDVQVSIEPGMEMNIDPKLAQVILENLLCNAWKFSANSTPPQIEVKSIANGDWKGFLVRDNGIGFDSRKVQERIYLPFERLQTAYLGTGIGLATVRRAVERLDGKITADSETGKGATFRVEFKGK
ncbi:MAG TPA: ATP-binding protein [Candidatus Kapabacteria bacterium]|nr:ATP-binding protein [Candidatus Kapabacteria bacterium]